MADHIWIVRDPSRALIAAAADRPFTQGAFDALRQARWYSPWTISVEESLALSVENTDTECHQSHGYTLTREPLEAQLVSNAYTLAASEPVAWAIVNRDGVTMDVRMTVTEAREHSIGGDTLRPLVFGDVAHPSAAGDLRGAAQLLIDAYNNQRSDSEKDAAWTALARSLAHPTTPTRGSDE